MQFSLCVHLLDLLERTLCNDELVAVEDVINVDGVYQRSFNTRDVLQAIQRQVASALDIIIHLGRIRDKTRKVLMIEEILGYEDGKIQTKTLYEFKEVGTENEKVKGSIMKVAELENTGKLVAAGY